MVMEIKIPEISVKEEEIKVLLAIKLFEEGLVSLGRAAEISGYSERTFSEILVRKGIPPIKYENINLEKGLNNV